MTHKYWQRIFLILLWSLLPQGQLFAGWDQYMFDDENLREELSHHDRPIYFDDEDNLAMDDTYDDETVSGSLHYLYLHNRRALVGENCGINKLINSVGIGSWNGQLESMVNEDLDDYCEFNSVVSLGVTTDPLLSIRDRSAYYAKGTTAGFCLIAGSGNSVLSLNLIKATSIGFYRDGKVVGLVPVAEGQDAGLLNLSLIQIPGSENACIYLEVESPGVFDEVALDFSGALDVGAGEIIRIKYAYVGKPREFTITKFNKYNNKYGMLPDTDLADPTTFYQEYSRLKYKDDRNDDVRLKSVTVQNAILLGIPIPMDTKNFTDEDLDNGVAITPIASIGYQGGGEFMMRHTGEEHWGEEVFEAGTEVGLVYDFGDVLSLGLGTWLNFQLYDANGNVVQEENIKGNVLGLGVAKGGAQSTSVVSSVPFSGARIRLMTTISVKVGAYSLHYAYVREAPDAPHHCPINPSASTDICRDQREFQLRSNPDVSVTWSVFQKPEGSPVQVSPDGKVTGLDPAYEDASDDYDYVFKATSVDGCEDFVVLTHRKDENPENYSDMCGLPIMDTYDEGTYVVVTEENYPGITGGLLHFDELKNPENILSASVDDYATYIGGLEVATNVPVIGVARTDGLIFDGTKEGATAKRLGFVVASDIEGLNLAALQFWQIRCYRNKKEVYNKVIDESNAISTDIGGSNTSQKMRYSIQVPVEDEDGNKLQVDAIILWCSGVADIAGGTLDIYYAFKEEADSGCSDPLGCSSQLLSTKYTHTAFDFEKMQSGSAIVVANAANDLDNLIDDDPNSFMSLANSVTAGSGIPIAVRLGRTVDYRHQLGIIMDNKTFLAGVNAGSWLTIETYYKGEPTGDSFSDWNAVDANVIGYGDKNVLIVQPRFMYDEVIMTIGKIVSALDIMKFYGLFLRGDIDNDGVPDCQDFNSCAYTIEDPMAIDVCEGEEMIVSAYGVQDTWYWVRFSEPDIPEDLRLQRVQAGHGGYLEARYETRAPGMYQMVFYEDEPAYTDKKGNEIPARPGTPIAAAPYAVHPDQTTWLLTATNTDWKKWDNWSNGSPYCCTRVIIPSDAINYPDLTGEVKDGDEYCCEYIHFEPKAHIGGAYRLNYEKAWVELSLTPNRYNLLSAPLKNMYTGDMFIPVAREDEKGTSVLYPAYFTDLTNDNVKENRFNPTIYQRKYSSAVYEKGWNADDAQLLEGLEDIEDLSMTKWSRNFNHVATRYLPAEGFSVWVDNGSLPAEDDVTFRFPKTHGEYVYFNDFDGRPIEDVKESVIRTESGSDGKDVDVSGRFIYEDKVKESISFDRPLPDQQGHEYHRTVYTGALPLDLTLEAPDKAETTRYFLLGNPFMSPINVKKLLLGNTQEIKGVMRYDGNVMHKVEYSGGVFVDADNFDDIAPMESVFLIAAEPAATISVRVTEDMLGLEKNEGSAPAERCQALYIHLSDGSNVASVAVVGDDEVASDEAIFDGEVVPTLALLASVGNKVYDIVQLDDALPLTLLSSGKGIPMKLSFIAEGGFPREDYELADILTGKTYGLDEEIQMPEDTRSSSGRYVLRKRNSEEKPGLTTDIAEGIFIESIAGNLRIISLHEGIKEAALYDLSGTLLSLNPGENQRLLTLRAPEGMLIISVRTSTGIRKSFKLLSR